MRKILAVTVTAVLGFGLVTAMSPTADAATRYKSCGTLHAKFPYGVAESRSAARTVVADGFEVPYIDKAIYNANWRHLDLDLDGVACEVMTPAAMATWFNNALEQNICDSMARRIIGNEMPAYCKKYGY
jgi:hypothetical protein